MNIIIEKTIFNEKQIEIIENSYKAKFVCETCIRNKDGWMNMPVAIFYTEKPHPDGSNWMAINWSYDGMICVRNGFSAVAEPFVGVVAENGDVIYSRFRHDFNTSPDRSVSIDGGRDYSRFLSEKNNVHLVSLQIKKDKLEIVS